jgi:hypothetical protein
VAPCGCGSGSATLKYTTKVFLKIFKRIGVPLWVRGIIGRAEKLFTVLFFRSRSAELLTL